MHFQGTAIFQKRLSSEKISMANCSYVHFEYTAWIIWRFLFFRQNITVCSSKSWTWHVNFYLKTELFTMKTLNYIFEFISLFIKMSISFMHGCNGGGEGSGKFKLIKFTNTENKFRTPPPPTPLPDGKKIMDVCLSYLVKGI